MLNDLRYAVRTLRQNPGFALTAVISIGLAIGANSAIFSFVDGLLFRPLPVRDPARVVSLRSIAPSSSASSLAETNTEISYPDFVDFRETSRSFDGLIAYDLRGVGFARGERNQPQVKLGYLVSGDFFRTLGVESSLGRMFTSEEDAVPGRDAVLVLAHDFWKQEFDADPAAVGSHVRLNGIDFTIIGVASEHFSSMDLFIRPTFFAPMMMASRLDPKEDILHRRDLRTIAVKGRLKRGVTVQAANAEISALAKSLQESYPVTNKGFGAAVRSELQMRLDRTPSYGPVVVSLFTLVAVVLAIACCNVANLMLSRGRARVREIAVRLAIGAGRARLMRQLMVENLVIAFCGGAAALLIAQFAVEFFSTLEVVGDTPIQLDITIDHRVLVFTFLIAAGSAVLFGLIPALHSTNADVIPALKAGALEQRRKRFFGRSALVVAQIAGSMVLLLAGVGAYRDSAGLIAQRGFRTDHLLTLRVDTEVVGYTSQQSQQFYRTLSERSRALPDVQAVGLTSSVPLTTTLRQEAVIPEGYQFPAGQKSVSVMSSTVDDDYFDTLAIPILRGRHFLLSDNEDSPRVAIVNQAFADKYFAADPIGKRIRLENETGPWVEIVGITATGKYLSVAEPPTGFLYLPVSQHPEQRLTLLVHSSGDPAKLTGPVRDLIRSIDPNVPLLAVRTMDDVFQRSTVRPMQVLITVFGATSLMGLVLAVVGLYAVVAYQVARKTREIGIRIALGAERPRVMRMILKHAAGMAVTGVAIGLVLSFALVDALSGGGQRPQPLNVFILMAVTLVLLLTTLLAAAIPARQAMRIDPQVALRQE